MLWLLNKQFVWMQEIYYLCGVKSTKQYYEIWGTRHIGIYCGCGE